MSALSQDESILQIRGALESHQHRVRCNPSTNPITARKTASFPGDSGMMASPEVLGEYHNGKGKFLTYSLYYGL